MSTVYIFYHQINSGIYLDCGFYLTQASLAYIFPPCSHVTRQQVTPELESDLQTVSMDKATSLQSFSFHT